MVLGIGTDIFKMDHLNTAYLDMEDPFVQKNFTQREYEQAQLRENPHVFLATRYAGKEAVYKALNWHGGSIAFCEIEINNGENGRPYVTLYGKVKEHAEKTGIKSVCLSLSYDSGYASAFAIAQDAVG